MRKQSFWILLLVAGCFLAAPFSWSVQSATGELSVSKIFSGDNRLIYQFRSGEEGHDSDFYDYWNLRGQNLFDGYFDAYFSGRIHKDLDGTAHSVAKDLFLSVEDRSPGWEDQIYQLYGDFHDKEGRLGLRFGRQYIDEADSLHLDGAALRVLPDGVLGGKIFLGRPVSYYSGVSGDWAGGLSLMSRPWEGNRTRLTYVRYDQDDLSDDWLKLDAWQRFAEEWNLHARASMLENQFLMGALDLIYLSLDGEMDAILTASHWAGSKQHTREYSPLFTALGELEPYSFLSARVTRSVLPWLCLSPGISARLMEGPERNARNQQYGNGDLAIIIEPNRFWDFTVSAEYWDVSQGDRFWGLTGEAEYRPSEKLEAAVGSQYADYRYHDYSDFAYAGSASAGDLTLLYDGTWTQITPSVYSYFARAKYEFNRYLSLRVRGEIEDHSFAKDLEYALRTSLDLRF